MSWQMERDEMRGFFLSMGYIHICDKALKTLDLTIGAECLPEGVEMTLWGVGA